MKLIFILLQLSKMHGAERVEWIMRWPAPRDYIQSRWQLETPNWCFWLVNILLRKTDTSLKKEMKTIITLILWSKTTKNMPKKVYESKRIIFLWTHVMLQTLERRKKYIGIILSDEYTLRRYCRVSAAEELSFNIHFRATVFNKTARERIGKFQSQFFLLFMK